MKPLSLAAAAAVAFVSIPAFAHFGVLMPSADVVTKAKTELGLTLAFSHPAEQNGMDLAQPVSFDVWEGNEKKSSLAGSLKPAKVLGHQAWQASYKVNRPGVYSFAFEPKPYWEPAEDKFIVHYTKVTVAALGEEEGWEKPLGLPAEIVPLTRPFANWAGSAFRGQVLFDGKPAPAGTPVEIEFWNGKQVKLPNDYFVTLGAVTDANGCFTFTAPFAGWWTFAALGEGPKKMKMDGKDRDVERGAVLWVNFSRVPAALAK